MDIRTGPGTYGNEILITCRPVDCVVSQKYGLDLSLICMLVASLSLQ